MSQPAAPAAAARQARVAGGAKAREKPIPVAKAAADPTETVAREEEEGRRRVGSAGTGSPRRERG
jgi:ribosomal protein L12E/L44/L45/RPP1/RPP2